MADLHLSRRLLLLGVVYALLAIWFLFATAENLVHVHTAFDAAACILAAVAASQLLGMSQRAGSSLALFAGLTFYAAGAAELFHLLTSVAWVEHTPFLQQSAQNLRPLTWPSTAYLPALGLIAALLLSGHAPPRGTGRFVALLALLLALSLGVFALVPPYTAPGWLGISRPGLIGAPLGWAGLAWMCWRARREDRLKLALGIGAALVFTGHLFILYSRVPHDAWAMLAHLGKVIGYAFLVLTLSRIDSLDAREVLEAGRRLRERTAELEAANQQLENEITERKEAEQALRQSEERYRVLFEKMDEGYCVIEMIYDAAGRPVDYRFVEINPAFEKHSGLPQALGKTIREIVPGHDAWWFEIYGQVARTGEAIRFENPASALERHFDVFAFRIGDDGGNRVGVLFKDITEQRRAAAEIRNLNAELERRVEERTRQLEEANQELESFSYSVSHDLRAPLRHVQGYVELLTAATHGQLSAEALEHLKVISEASGEMGQLIDDLLAFSRTSRTAMRAGTVRLDEVVPETIRGLELATRDRHIAWKIAPLPAVTGDRALLRQVFANLLGNAVKYSRPRDPAEIEVGCAGDQDGRVVLLVRDNGVGFNMKYVHKLFGVFQRLHKASEFEGTGIGLATVQRVIHRHGGRIWAESAPNQGATFYFTLQPAATAQTSLRGNQNA